MTLKLLRIFSQWKQYFNPLHMEQLTTATVAKSIFAYIVIVSFTAVIYILHITYFYLAMYIYMKKCCFSDRNSHRNYERVLLPSAWKFKFSNWNSRWHRIFSRITMRISLGKAAGFELYVTIYRAIFSQLL